MSKTSKEPTVDNNTGNDVVSTTVDSTSTLADVSATVDGKKYTFPVNEGLSLDTAVKLSQYFVIENLKSGQKFSFNPTVGTMLFLPEFGVRLDSNNYLFVYSGEELTEAQKDRLLSAVRTGALLISDLGLKPIKTTLSESKINCQVMLDKPISVFKKDITDILGKVTKVEEDGSIDSPYADLKALLDYESANKNRKDVVDLLRKAMNKIGGTVEFISKMTEVKPVGHSNTKPGTRGPAPAGNPMIAKSYL